MVDRIDPALAGRLDAFTVPDLPGGFADAVLARADARNPRPLPRTRPIARRRWWRTGASTLGVIAAATISISAAASGVLGDPIRRVVASAPVIGPVVERVVPRLVRPERPMVARRARPEPVTATATKPDVDEAPPADAEGVIAPGYLAEIRRIMDERLADAPEAREWLDDHPRAANRIVHRAALREALARAARERGIAMAEARQIAREARAEGERERTAALAEARRAMREARAQGDAERTAALAEAREARNEGHAERRAALSEARAARREALSQAAAARREAIEAGRVARERAREGLGPDPDFRIDVPEFEPGPHRGERLRRLRERLQRTPDAEPVPTEPNDLPE